MSRYLYSNLLRIISCFILSLVFIPSAIYLICSLSIEQTLNIPSFVCTAICLSLHIALIFFVYILNILSRNKIVFQNSKIRYQGIIEHSENLSMVYFKFHISITDPSLVIPKLLIRGERLYKLVYLSKRDIKRLRKLNFSIKEV